MSVEYIFGEQRLVSDRSFARVCDLLLYAVEWLPLGSLVVGDRFVLVRGRSAGDYWGMHPFDSLCHYEGARYGVMITKNHVYGRTHAQLRNSGDVGHWGDGDWLSPDVQTLVESVARIVDPGVFSDELLVTSSGGDHRRFEEIREFQRGVARGKARLVLEYLGLG